MSIQRHAAQVSDALVFFRFGLVGIVGFAVDATVLALLLWLGAGFYLGRVCSYIAAASCTWAINRRWTFRDKRRGRVRQWGQFLAANSLGGAVNYGFYALIVSHFQGESLGLPILGVASGSIAGLVVNFMLSKHLVFGSWRPQRTSRF